MDSCCVLGRALIGATLGACAPMSAHAQLAAGRQVTVIQRVTASTYVNGGIGADERAVMYRVVGDFPLRMSFSEGKDGEFLADIPLVISDSSGSSVFELRKVGPILYVMLPPGRYQVSARFEGVTQTQTVTLAGGPPTDLRFHWDGAPARQAWTAASN
jgi:hypothetical protein